MENLIQPFLTYYRQDVDYSVADAAHEFNLMVQRNEAIDAFLTGHQDVDYMLDVLNDQGIEPEEYLEAVESEIEYFQAFPHKLYC